MRLKVNTPFAPHNVHSKTLLGGFFLALRDVSHQKLARLGRQENGDLWLQFAAFNFSAGRRQRRQRNRLDMWHQIWAKPCLKKTNTRVKSAPVTLDSLLAQAMNLARKLLLKRLRDSRSHEFRLGFSIFCFRFLPCAFNIHMYLVYKAHT